MNELMRDLGQAGKQYETLADLMQDLFQIQRDFQMKQEAAQRKIGKILRYASRRNKVKLRRYCKWCYSPRQALAFYGLSNQGAWI
jgi:RNase P subunit RPR2